VKRRQWTSAQKLKIVLEGLSGQIEISKLCSKYQIAQTQYYQWRDQLLKFGKSAFEQKDVSKREQKLNQENRRLKNLVGELTLELKKTELELEELDS
jgi:transposase-like protein